MQVTVYSLPGSVCHQCRFTKRKLDEYEIEYTEVRLDQDSDALDKVKALGYSSAPVVVVDAGDGATWSWQGFQPTQIEMLDELAA